MAAKNGRLDAACASIGGENWDVCQRDVDGPPPSTQTEKRKKKKNVFKIKKVRELPNRRRPESEIIFLKIIIL